MKICSICSSIVATSSDSCSSPGSSGTKSESLASDPSVVCIRPVTVPSRRRRSIRRGSVISSSVSSQPSRASATKICSTPSVASISSPAKSYQPSSLAMFAKSCDCRKRSISSSGLGPGSTLRNTFRTERSSKTIDELDCSAPIARTLPPRLGELTVWKRTAPAPPLSSAPSAKRWPSSEVACGSTSAS